MDITPNPLVIGLQVVPFLITILGLYSLIFKPMLAHLEGREDAIEGAQGRAKELEAQLAARAAEYEEKLTAARIEMAELRGSRRAEAMAEAEAMVKAARTEAEAELDAAVTAVQSQATAAREGLKGSSAVLAQHIASQVLGRPVAS
jgi:F-type H+-transporting ATPase subunit b